MRKLYEIILIGINRIHHIGGFFSNYEKAIEYKNTIAKNKNILNEKLSPFIVVTAK